MAALRHVAQSIAISRSPADRALAISSAKKFARWIVTPASAPAAVAQLARSPNGERDASPSEEIVRRSSARVPVLSFAEGGSMASHSADQRHPSHSLFLRRHAQHIADAPEAGFVTVRQSYRIGHSIAQYLDFSTKFESFITIRSANLLPTICIPIGSPSEVNPQLIEDAG